ncbi:MULTISPECIES: MipA/OmpV family protein [Pseudomonas]|uniref:MipA/OmpV family protein n=1 Tax=Pseudomonas tritici TaxID=2745518 RepID=A0A8I0CZA5_9PSED|nr:MULTISPECIES: MipA/OmpV family protein [Pseudomonas]MBP2870606.1 MipA/OmpV family protein [Pseudomonas sp. SWRI144]MBW8125865.1 MipA/OmpV family protein [Pseudomonas sp. LAP_36]MBW8136520.1 MipA/OmpV family protein [Pseudomonas sp. PAMC 26818]QXH85169.1 MipA/OmpV family protein [Pseudomonas tritici]CRL99756.1 MltA-interacting protein precursor [Pseudomonas sp. 24 R 17]
MLKATSAVFAGLLGLCGFSSTVRADAITGEVGAGFSYQPHDPTGSRYETRPVPYLDLDWGDVSLSTDDGLTWSALNTNGLTAGPYINYLQGRTSNGSLQGLRNVSDMAEIGGFIQYAPADFWRIYARLGQAVGGGHSQSGALGKLGSELGYPLGGGIIGSTGLAANFADARQTQTYFGVDANESAASGIRPYNASGGFQNVTLTQSFEFPLDAKWSLLTSASWVHLVGSAADSSIVKQTGDVNQGQVQTAISYKFD